MGKLGNIREIREHYVKLGKLGNIREIGEHQGTPGNTREHDGNVRTLEKFGKLGNIGEMCGN